jgi:hypothetical protein
MSKLDDLRQKMYSLAFKGRQRRVPIPSEESSSRATWEGNAKVKGKYFTMITGMLLASLIIFGLLYASVQSGLLFYFLGRSEVELKIVAPEEAVAGDRTVYSVVYKNNSNKAIRNVKLVFEYPKDSEPVGETGEKTEGTALLAQMSLPDIPSGGEAHTEFRAKIFGKENNSITARATLTYEPENLQTKFTVKSQSDTRIIRVPIALSFTGSQKTRGGDSYEFDLEYASNATTDFKNIYIKINFPDGFQFRQSSILPEFKAGGYMIWRLNTLEPGSSGSIHVRGVMNGAALEPKTFQYSLGTYYKETAEWISYVDRTVVAEIVSSPLSVEAKIGGERDTVVSLGDGVNVVLSFKNNSSVSIQNIALSAALEGPIDFETIQSSNGTVVNSREIRWSPATDNSLSEILPGDEKTLNFSFRLKRSEKVAAGKNLAVTITSKIDGEGDESLGPNLSGADSLVVPIRAANIFQAKALYTGTLIKNSGPIPPKVGSRTTYAIVWEVGAQGGDLTNTQVKGVLPPYVKWEGVVVPSTEKIAFQPSTGEVIWSPGTLKADGDISRRVMFKVSFIPSETQLNNDAVLIKENTITALDSFTNTDLKSTVRDVTTNLLDDFGIPPNSGRVQP